MAKQYITPGDIGAADANHNLGDHGDVDLTGLTAGDTVYWNGTNFVRVALPTAPENVWSSGDLKTSARTTPETGWALADGAEVSRTDPVYEDLFAAIGTTYGVGDGASTFNLPDFRGKTIVGAGTGPGLTARALGDEGGEEEHQLTLDELANHVHWIGLTRSADTPTSGGAQRAISVNSDTGSGWGISQGAADMGGVAETTEEPHNNMQPYGVANVFIKL